MATKPTQKVRVKLKFGLVEFLKGDFLVSEDFRKLWPLILEIVVCFLLMIYSNHTVNQKIKKINLLKDEVEEIRSQNAFVQSRLINIKLESEIEKNLAKDTVKQNNPDALRALDSHPLKIVLKLDENNHVTK